MLDFMAGSRRNRQHPHHDIGNAMVVIPKISTSHPVLPLDFLVTTLTVVLHTGANTRAHLRLMPVGPGFGSERRLHVDIIDSLKVAEMVNRSPARERRRAFASCRKGERHSDFGAMMCDN